MLRALSRGVGCCTCRKLSKPKPRAIDLAMRAPHAGFISILNTLCSCPMFDNSAHGRDDFGRHNICLHDSPRSVCMGYILSTHKTYD
jgi:hypothetical protein